MSGVYRILNTVTGDFYIGSSKHIDFRWETHRSLLNRGVHHSRHLQRAWTKYGPDSFQFEVMTEVDPGKLLDVEQESLDTHRPAYNIRRKAGCVPPYVRKPITEETREKMRRSHKGKKLTEEAKQKMSAARRGKPVSPETLVKMKARRASDETKEKLRQSHLGQPGRVWTEESREKVRQSLTGRKRPPEVGEKVRKALIAAGVRPPSRLGTTFKMSPAAIEKRVQSRLANKERRLAEVSA